MSKNAGHILYDGSCGFCSKWVKYWEPTFKKRGFEIAALQEEWVLDHVKPANEAELLHDLLLLFADGTMLRGSQAYRFVMKKIWWSYPLYVLTLLPGLRQIFDWSYRKFADNRHKISSTCRIQVEELPQDDSSAT